MTETRGTDETLPEIREGLVVRPGDRLVVRVDPRTSLDQVHALAEAFRERFSDGVVTVVGAEELAVVRGDSAA